MMVICICCRARLEVSSHELGCLVTRRAVSDDRLAFILSRITA